jgi:predicted transcriptional regulator
MILILGKSCHRATQISLIYFARPDGGWLKRRPNILIYAEMLRFLLDGPKGPSRLAQSLGLNFYKFVEFAEFLESRQVIRKEVREGREVYFITPKGAQVLEDWKRVASAIGQ